MRSKNGIDRHGTVKDTRNGTVDIPIVRRIRQNPGQEGYRMFRACAHKDVAASLETIGAAFAIFESRAGPGGSVLVSANSLFVEITERPVLECIGLSLTELLPRYVEKQMRACLGLCLSTQCPQETELVVERDGAARWWRLLVSPVLPDGSWQRTIFTLIEITEKKLLEHKLEIARQRFEALVKTAYDGIITVDQNQTIRMLNESARDIFGVADDAVVVGEHLSRFIPPRFRDKHTELVDSFRNSTVNVRPMQSRPVIYGLRADGGEFPVEVTISKIRVGNEIEMTAVVRDISERTKLLEQLTQAATQDLQTGIFNRRHGTAVLNAEIHRCRRFSRALSVAMFDIDYFKTINDTHGHACGDLVLSSVVAAVSKTLRDTDTFCRWGGDEFLVLLPETVLDDALNWAERVREAVAGQAITCFGDQAVKVTASFGLAASADEDSVQEDLVKRADAALYRAKESGRNQVASAPRQRKPGSLLGIRESQAGQATPVPPRPQ